MGQNITLSESSIIGLFDIDNCTSSQISKAFLSRAEREGQIINVFEEDIPKSFVVAEENDKIDIYLSHLTTATLQKRSEDIGIGE